MDEIELKAFIKKVIEDVNNGTDSFEGKVALLHQKMDSFGNNGKLNDILSECLDDVCTIIIKDSSRDLDADYIFAYLHPQNLKKALDFISNQSQEIVEAENKTTNIGGSDIAYKLLYCLDYRTVYENSDSLNRIFDGNIQDKNSLDYIDYIIRADVFKSIVNDKTEIYRKNPEQIYGEISKMSKSDILDEITSNKFLEKLLVCINYSISQDEYALVNNDFISMLYQLSRIKSGEYSLVNDNITISENLAKLKPFFDERADKLPKPDMEKYDNQVTSLSDMDDSQFDEFIEDLKKLKNCNGVLPEKYCDYLIQQKIKSNSVLNRNLDKYFSIFKRAFEDKAQHILSSYGISGYTVQVVKTLDKETGGNHGDKEISFNEQELHDLSKSNPRMIATLFHETRHALQWKHFLNNDYKSGYEYNMVKDYIIIRNGDYKEYFHRNYKYLYFEIDARIHGAKGMFNYLQQLGFSSKDISLWDKYKNTQLDDINLYHAPYGAQKKYYNNGDDLKKMTTMFQKIIKKNSNSILGDYPIFSIEFDQNGKRKSGFDILADYEQALKAKQADPKNYKDNRLTVIPEILKRRSPVLNKTALEDSKKLLTFETDNKVIKFYRDIIIENELLDLIIKRKSKRTIYTSLTDEQDKDAKENFNTMIGNLYKFATEHPEEPISNTILESIREFIPQEQVTSTAEVTGITKTTAYVKSTESTEAAKAEQAKLADISSGVSPEERQEGTQIITSQIKAASKSDKTPPTMPDPLQQ